MSAIRRPDRGNEWWVDFRLDGKRIRKRSPIQTKPGATEFERDLIIELRSAVTASAPAGAPPVRDPLPTFGEFADRYLTVHVAAQLRPSSQRSVRSKLRAHALPFFAEKRLDDIGPLDLASFTASQVALGLKPKTVNNHLSMVRSVLATAHEWGMLTSIPRVRWVRVPEPATQFLSNEEVARLLTAASAEFWRPFITFLVHTGARFGEAAALRWEDLEIEAASPVVHIRRGVASGFVGSTKTGKHREVPLIPSVLRELRAFRHDRPFVFCRPADGKFFDPASTRKHLHAICDRAGVRRISWHVLRHTFATELTRRGAPLPAVQKLLGHSTIKMTERYIHVVPTMLRPVVMLLQSNHSYSEAINAYSGHQMATNCG